jgi:hypothetical protein
MTRIAALVALSGLIGACATAHESRPSGALGKSSRVPATRDYTGAPTAAPAAPARDFEGARASGAPMEQEADERPGLGTEWGETRNSRVNSVAFEREDPRNPFVAVSLYYNDANGIRAMTRGAALGSPMQSGVGVAGGALSVRLLDAAGRPLSTYELGARNYVVGSDGERYVMELRNNTGNRFEAVATVDGLDVMDGRPGSFDKRGYLIAPWSTVQIDGFRQNLDEVAAFRFGAVRDSYATKKGDDRNVGVIGVAFFSERYARAPILEREIERRHDADPFPDRFASPPNR